LAGPTAAVLLTPLVTSSFANDRWALLLLSCVSAAIILAANPIKKRLPATTSKTDVTTVLLALFFVILGYGFGIHKLMPAAGILLFVLAIFSGYQLAFKTQISLYLCLGLMIPLPAGVEDIVGLRLAFMEADLFVNMAQAIGLNIFNFGSQVISGDTSVTINSSCSGTLLLWPALMGCITAANMTKRSALQQIFIIVSALPFAFCVNLLRLFTLLSVNFIASDVTIMTLHDALGWFVMPLVWGVPIWLASNHSIKELQFPRLNLGLPISISLIILASLTSFYLQTDTAVGAPKTTTQLPYYFSGWIGSEETITSKERQILGAEYVARHTYTHKENNRSILVTAILHKDKAKSEQHSSVKCYQALGWRVDQFAEPAFTIDGTIEHLRVRKHRNTLSVSELTTRLASLHDDTHWVLRLQIVEEPHISAQKREATLNQLRAAITHQMEIPA